MIQIGFDDFFSFQECFCYNNLLNTHFDIQKVFCPIVNKKKQKKTATTKNIIKPDCIYLELHKYSCTRKKS